MQQYKLFILSIFVLLISVVLGYFPSLYGGFIYDDFWSLEKLSIISADISWENLSAYLNSSDTGPLKRPISMLTFLMDAQDWPADPYVFRLTNLILHLLNALLLFCLVFSVLKRKGNKHAVWMALFTTLLWALHPFLVSTVAYVVQRMAMLPVFFSLLSLLLYLRIRLNYPEFSLLKSSTYLFLNIYGMTLLAALSKENGLLILFYIPLFEYFLCQKYLGMRPMKKQSSWLFTALPIAILVMALLIKLPDFYQGHALREFSFFERLISEPRALAKYLYHWVVPSVMTEGVYTDTFKASTSLLDPLSTVFALLFVVILISVAIKFRNKWPLFAFAVLFYFIAHIIESTIIPLQLYFEHRNYAAFLFLGLPVVVALGNGIKNSKMAWVVLISLTLFLLTQTFLRATLWGNTSRLKITAFENYPDSIRARIGVVEMLENKANYQNGLELLEQGIELQASPALVAFKLKLKCQFEQIKPFEIQELTQALTAHGLSHQDVLPIGRLVQSLLNNQCEKTVDRLSGAEEILDAVLTQLKADSSLGWSMHDYASGRLAHSRQQFNESTELFIKAFKQDKDYELAIMAAAQLLNSGQAEMALKLLEVVEQAYHNSLFANPRIENEIERFLNLSHEEIAAKHENINHNPSQE